MKTVFHVLIILLAAVVVAAGIYLVVNNSGILSSTQGGDGSGQPQMNQQFTSGDMPTRPEGGHDESSGSISRGLSEAGSTLLKIGIVTLVLVVVEKIAQLVFRKKNNIPSQESL